VLGGVQVRKGEAILPYGPSANLDETVFEDPLTLDITREHNPHIAFGHGAHHCLRAQLARVELQIAIETFFTRLPDVRITSEDDITWREGILTHGPRVLPVAWTEVRDSHG